MVVISHDIQTDNYEMDCKFTKEKLKVLFAEPADCNRRRWRYAQIIT